VSGFELVLFVLGFLFSGSGVWYMFLETWLHLFFLVPVQEKGHGSSIDVVQLAIWCSRSYFFPSLAQTLLAALLTHLKGSNGVQCV